MPGIVPLVTAISNDVVAKLAAAGALPLTDGQIVLGRSRRFDNSFAPRVVFIPKSSRFEPRSTPIASSPVSPTNPYAPGATIRSYNVTQYGGGYSSTPTVRVSAPDIAGSVQATAAAVVRNGSVVKVVPVVAGSGYLRTPTVTITDPTGTNANATANLAPTPQGLAVLQQRAILTEVVTFEVHCWGIASVNGVASSDANADFDAAQALYQQVIASTHLLAAGVYRISGGRWVDYSENATRVDVAGHDFIFNLELATPLTDSPLSFVPVGTQPIITSSLLSFASGTPEQGSSG